MRESETFLYFSRKYKDMIIKEGIKEQYSL